MGEAIAPLLPPPGYATAYTCRAFVAIVKFPIAIVALVLAIVAQLFFFFHYRSASVLFCSSTSCAPRHLNGWGFPYLGLCPCDVITRCRINIFHSHATAAPSTHAARNLPTVATGWPSTISLPNFDFALVLRGRTSLSIYYLLLLFFYHY
jgi:hypothetical protein